ncbi:family 43 glycosylhydrolase [Photobacterium sp. DNB23_23_1]
MRNILGKGVCDPHIRIFDGRAYMYASHDFSDNNNDFVMKDWWVWSSNNLVDWQLESVISPEDTYLCGPSNGCWATDAVRKNDLYYWYFSDVREGIKQIGVLVSENPTKDWRDPLKKPLISSDDFDEGYDPAIFQEEDGSSYLVFGAFDYYISKLSNDMISLAEEPRKIEIISPRGPYGESTDDKAFLHKRGKFYYLSWGCFYAMAENVYGPYEYKGVIVREDLVEEDFKKYTWPNGLTQGRHGSFFEWNNQEYFTYCDMSQGLGNRYYRDSWISYVNYRENGEIEPIVINSVGVGRYEPDRGKILACNYFKSTNTKKVECHKGFAVQLNDGESCLAFPNITSNQCFKGLKIDVIVEYELHCNITINVHSNSGSETIIKSICIDDCFEGDIEITFDNPLNIDSVELNFSGESMLGMKIFSLSFI